MSFNYKAILKSLWWILVLCFIGFFLIGNINRVEAVIQQLSIATIIYSISALSLGKLFLVAIMHQSLQRYQIEFSVQRCFYIYNLTQLGKYIPGSIWQFVGRIGLYKEAGLRNHAIRDTLLLETFWVVSSAFLLGLFLICITHYEMLISIFLLLTNTLLTLISSVAFIIVLIVIAGPWRNKILSYSPRLIYTPASLLIVLFIWIFLGLSFWVTLLPLSNTEIGLVYIIGLYAFSYAAGFVVPFAPAGIGIRESVLVFGLTPYLDTNTSIILATLNRIFYIAIEIILAAAALKLSNKPRMEDPIQ
ncbi:MAG: hypothetical protein KZQ81_06040 [Candidatus Thiodiazotropha sp. (ex Rostrolucina anterorostrata)]|nr:hypothetical protein [Candidatus Thiodiazotropha sp. (ex Rostrolucina anterorostrata)]